MNRQQDVESILSGANLGSDTEFDEEAVVSLLRSERVLDLNQCQLVALIKCALIAFPESMKLLSAAMLEAVELSPRWRKHGKAFMYKERELRESLLLGLLESVNLIEEDYEAFQNHWPSIVYQLLFDDGSNWGIRDSSIAKRFSMAIKTLGEGLPLNRNLRISQLVGLVFAARGSNERFRGGWHHDICQHLVDALFDTEVVRGSLPKKELFVQDQLKYLMDYFSLRTEFGYRISPDLVRRNSSARMFM